MIAIDKKGQVRNGAKILGFMVLLGTMLAIAAFFPFSHQIKSWISVGIVLAVSWVCLHFENETFASIGIALNTRFFIQLLMGMLIGVLLIAILALTINIFGGFFFIRNSQVGIGNLFYGLIFFLQVSLVEELFFRGYIFQRTIRGLGKTVALLIFALFFVLAHWANPGMMGSTKLWASLNIGLASVLLGLAFIKTGSLALPIGIHLGWNWTQGCLLGFGVSGHLEQGFWAPIFSNKPDWLTGGEFGLEASLAGTAMLLLACVCLAIWRSIIPSAASGNGRPIQ